MNQQLYRELQEKAPSYKAGDVCGMLGINRTTLSLYEKYGLLVGRKIGNKRIYSFEEYIEFLRKTEGMEISNTEQGIKEAAAIIKASGRN